MKKFAFLLLPLVLFSGACSSAAKSGGKQLLHPLSYVPSVPDTENNYQIEPAGGISAMDYFRENGLSVGWNLGNTLDAWSGGIIYMPQHPNNSSGEDANWGNPKANQEIFNGIIKSGFNVARIPITWFGHIGPAPDYHIEEAFLRRVAEVIGYARQAGFNAVIINLHHDGSTSADGGKVNDHGWLSLNTARADAQGYNEVTFQFARVWMQIARYFKNYGDWLMFENFNELHDGGWGWSPEAQQKPQYDIINKWNQLFTDAVRGTGANNETRFLVYNGYSAGLKHLLADYFVLPADTAANRQIVEFHYYDPYEFGIISARSNWGSEADRQKTDRDFAPLKAKFTDNSIPVILGECGAVRQLYPDNPEKQEAARLARREYVAHIFAAAHKYGIVPVYWDNGDFSSPKGEKFSLYNRADGQPNSDESAFLINAMVNAVK